MKGKTCDLPAPVDYRKKCLGIKLSELVRRYRRCHDWPLFQGSKPRGTPSSYHAGMNKCRTASKIEEKTPFFRHALLLVDP